MIFERDDQRAEVRKNVAGYFYWWPKVDGMGNVWVAPATAQLYRPNGEAIGDEIDLIAAQPPALALQRLRVDVPAIDELGEDFFAVITWTLHDETYEDTYPDQIFERVSQVQFDVVLQPWGESRVAINDLEGTYSNIRARVQRIVDVWNEEAFEGTEHEITVAGAASIFGSRAHSDLYRRIRNKITLELNAPPPSRLAAGFPLHLYTRPRLIVDRVALQPIEVAIALAMIFESDITDGAEQAEAEKLAKYWFDKATSLLLELGGLRYDFSEDRIPDTTIQKVIGPVVSRRKQAR